MKKYLFRRLLQMIPVLLIISFAVFTLMHVAGDPVAMMLPADATEQDRQIMREALGLNKPFIEQFGLYMKNMLQGDFGESFRYGEDAMKIVVERLPATLELAVISMIFSIIISIPLGIWSANSQNSFFDLFITGVSVLGRAMPNFWLGIMLILFLAVENRIFLPSGRGTLSQLVLPGLTLAFGMSSQITPLIRSSMLDILHQDYIRTARSKGLRESIVVYKHAFRNALIPVVTIMALQIPTLIGGALITETVFSWPGLGQLVVQAINGGDMAIVQASVFVIAVVTIVINLTADMVYCLIDPRIKYK